MEKRDKETARFSPFVDVFAVATVVLLLVIMSISYTVRRKEISALATKERPAAVLEQVVSPPPSPPLQRRITVVEAPSVVTVDLPAGERFLLYIPSNNESAGMLLGTFVTEKRAAREKPRRLSFSRPVNFTYSQWEVRFYIQEH